MLQETIQRAGGVDTVVEPIIVRSEENRFLVAEQVRHLGDLPCTMLLEPVGRSTAPTLTLAVPALADFYHESQSDSLMLVMPADDMIRDLAAFHTAVRQAEAPARVGHWSLSESFPRAQTLATAPFIARGRTRWDRHRLRFDCQRKRRRH